MFAESAGGLLLPTKGLITVDLCDADTGRVLQREESENFLSLQTLKVAKWWQRMMWGAYNPVETSDTAGNKPSEMPWFPAQHLAYWNDATAESAGTEDAVLKDLIGWASRHPIGSASGKRGLVNITECEFKDASAKWVFDWTTSQGNGTFQSVGWTRVDESTSFPIARFPEDDSINFTNTGTAAGGVNNALWWDAGNSLWNLTEWVSGSTQYRVASAAAAGGATTQICLLPAAAWRADSSFTGFLLGLARIGTDIVTCGFQVPTGTQAKLMRHTSAGVQVWSRAETTLAVQYADCTIDGSGNIWTAGSDGVIRRHSASDGTIAASVTPVAGPTVLEGIAFDAADGNFWVVGTIAGTTKQVWKIDSSGNTVGPLFSLRINAASVTSTSPYAGTYTLPNSAAREPFLLDLWRITAAAGTDIARTPSRNGPSWAGPASTLAVKSAEVWTGNRSGSGTEVGGAGRASAIRGGTLGTRSKLTLPITKTNTQTLKVTYQFNFS